MAKTKKVVKVKTAMDMMVERMDVISERLSTLNQRVDSLKDAHKLDKKRINSLQSRIDLTFDAVDRFVKQDDTRLKVLEKQQEDRIKRGIDTYKQQGCDHWITLEFNRFGFAFTGATCGKCGKHLEMDRFRRSLRRLYKGFTKS